MNRAAFALARLGLDWLDVEIMRAAFINALARETADLFGGDWDRR